MTEQKPNAKFDHLYVVLRVDSSDVVLPVDSRLSAVSAFDEREDAEAEAARLQALRPDDRSRYLVLPTRHKG